ncbi:MAG: helix-turn-helix domain-containing protein [Haloferacaceae archaeon]
MATELLGVAVDVWHPDCWTLQVTRDRDGGLLGHGSAPDGDRCLARYTAYGPDRDAVSALVDAVDASPLTAAVAPLPDSSAATHGSTATELLVEYDPGPSVRSAFADRGFLHHGPTRHQGGRERRTLLARADRDAVGGALDDLAAAYDADVDLVRLTATPAAGRGDGRSPRRRLSPRQRQCLTLARERGYYAYPREVDAGDLAAEVGVTTTTFLEHLRKAEAKVLGDAPDG